MWKISDTGDIIQLCFYELIFFIEYLHFPSILISHSTTQQILKATEMRILRIKAQKSLLDRESDRRFCQIKNINKWGLERIIGWNDHMTHMMEDRMVKVARDRLPSERDG